MALTFTTGMSVLNTAEAVGSVWAAARFAGSGQGPSAALDTTVFRAGSGSIAVKSAGNNWNSGLTYSYYADNASTALNMTTVGNEVLTMWVLATTPGTAVTEAADGFYIMLSSSTEAFNSEPTVYSEWTVGGSDRGTNGWKLFVLDTGKAANTANDVGGGVDLTAVTKIGFGIRSVSSVGNVKADNLYIDNISIGNPLYTMIGDGTTVGTWDSFLQDSLTAENGLVEAVPGGIAFSSGIAFGTAGQTATTTLESTKSVYC